MDREIARGAILKACRKLAVGQEARLDKNVVRSAFPPGPDDRAFEAQVLEFLQAANDGVFASRPIAGGDCIVSRRVRKTLVRESEPSRAIKASKGKPPGGRINVR